MSRPSATSMLGPPSLGPCMEDEALEFYKPRHPEVTISLGDCRMG